MRKRMWSTAAAFVVLLSGAAVVLGGPRVLAADGRVSMVEGSQSDYTTWKFDPVEITVPAGTTVVWHNNGQIEHTATAEDKSFDSGNLKTGAEFQFKFSTPGDFKYVCTPHKDLGMKGVVHVAGASTPTTAAPTTTTQPGSTPTSATTTTTTKPGPSSTTTSTAATSTAAGSGSTTTTAAAVTTTTIASTGAPSAASDAAATTTTTSAAQGGESAAAPKGSAHKKNSPVGITFAAVSTLLLTAVAAKLLASKP